MKELRLNAIYKNTRLNDIDVIETDIGMFRVGDREVVFTNTEDKFTIGVKLQIRLKKEKKLKNFWMGLTYLDPEWFGAFVELNNNEPISKIIDAINTCIEDIIDGIKQMYAQPTKEEA